MCAHMCDCVVNVCSSKHKTCKHVHDVVLFLLIRPITQLAPASA